MYRSIQSLENKTLACYISEWNNIIQEEEVTFYCKNVFRNLSSFKECMAQIKYLYTRNKISMVLSLKIIVQNM